MGKYASLALALAVTLGVGFAGSYFTNSSVDTWYPALVKPFWTPPDWVFGPVWTLLYIMMGFSLWFLWIDIQDKTLRKPYLLFALQLSFNAVWSYLFFGLRCPLLALVDLMLIIVFLIATIMVFHSHSKRAAYLLLPYLFWVLYAFTLNFAIVMLNQA